MNKINLFILLLLILGLFACANQSSEKKAETKKPNIIFIMSDDHAYQAISSYNDKLIQTPNIDRLADEGMIFTNACVSNSLCAPSRATLLTGKHTHINGKINNNQPFDTSNVTFPQIFQKAGYQTAMFGKLHFGNNPKGVDEFKILPGQGNYINPKFITKQGDTVVTGYVTDIITDFALDWLENQRLKDKPFLMFYFHKAPHRPWWPRSDKFKEFSKKKFPQPASLFDDYQNRGTAAKTAEMNILKHMMYQHDMKIRPETMKEMGEINPPIEEWKWGFIGPYGRMNEEQKAQYDPVIDSINKYFKENWPNMTIKEKMEWKYQRYMQDYLACISSVDDNIGRLEEYLDKNGLSENTVIIYTSDQGFYLGEHGWFDKRFMYKESFNTPLLVKWPGVVKEKSEANQIVQNLDFAQTLLEAAGIKAPDDMQGESFLPILKGHPEKWTRDAVYYHYYEYPSVHMVKRHYGIRTKKYKLMHFYYDIDEWELYDLEKDPNEMMNQYNNPEYSEIKEELHKRLEELRKQYKDSEELDQQFLKSDLERQNKK